MVLIYKQFDFINLDIGKYQLLMILLLVGIFIIIIIIIILILILLIFIIIIWSLSYTCGVHDLLD